MVGVCVTMLREKLSSLKTESMGKGRAHSQMSASLLWIVCVSTLSHPANLFKGFKFLFFHLKLSKDGTRRMPQRVKVVARNDKLLEFDPQNICKILCSCLKELQGQKWRETEEKAI